MMQLCLSRTFRYMQIKKTHPKCISHVLKFLKCCLDTIAGTIIRYRLFGEGRMGKKIKGSEHDVWQTADWNWYVQTGMLLKGRYLVT